MLLLLSKHGLDLYFVDAPITIRIDVLRDAIRRRLENEVRSFVRLLLLHVTYLSLISDHRLIGAVLIRDKLSLICIANNRINGLILLVLLGQSCNECLFTQMKW